MATAFSKGVGGIRMTGGSRRRSGSSESEPSKRVRSGTALRDQYGNLQPGEFNNATKKPLGYSDPNPSKIRTPSISSPSVSQFERNSAFAAKERGETPAATAPATTGSTGMIKGAAFKTAGVPMNTQARGGLGTPMWSVRESANPIAPRPTTTAPKMAASAFRSAPLTVVNNPDGTRSVSGQYGSGSTVKPPTTTTSSAAMLAKAPAAGRSAFSGMAVKSAAPMEAQTVKPQVDPDKVATLTPPMVNRFTPSPTRQSIDRERAKQQRSAFASR